MAKSQPIAKKVASLRAKEEERLAKLKVEVDGWMTRFDINNDNILQRDELRALLVHLHPERVPSEDSLDFLIEKATAVETYSLRIAGNKNGVVSWHEVRPTVLRYHEYCKDQTYLDKVFRRFDTDESGTLDASELPALLRAVAPEGCAVDDADVHHIFHQCDLNGDGVISREEVLPMIASWTTIAVSKTGAEAPSREKQQWDWIMTSTVPLGKRLVAAAHSAQDMHKAVSSTWRKASTVARLSHATDSSTQDTAAVLPALVKAAQASSAAEGASSSAAGALPSAAGAAHRPSPRQAAPATYRSSLNEDSYAGTDVIGFSSPESSINRSTPLRDPGDARVVLAPQGRSGRVRDKGAGALMESISAAPKASSSSMCTIL